MQKVQSPSLLQDSLCSRAVLQWLRDHQQLPLQLYDTAHFPKPQTMKRREVHRETEKESHQWSPQREQEEVDRTPAQQQGSTRVSTYDEQEVDLEYQQLETAACPTHCAWTTESHLPAFRFRRYLLPTSRQQAAHHRWRSRFFTHAPPAVRQVPAAIVSADDSVLAAATALTGASASRPTSEDVVHGQATASRGALVPATTTAASGDSTNLFLVSGVSAARAATSSTIVDGRIDVADKVAPNHTGCVEIKTRSADYVFRSRYSVTSNRASVGACLRILLPLLLGENLLMLSNKPVQVQASSLCTFAGRHPGMPTASRLLPSMATSAPLSQRQLMCYKYCGVLTCLSDRSANACSSAAGPIAAETNRGTAHVLPTLFSASSRTVAPSFTYTTKQHRCVGATGVTVAYTDTTPEPSAFAPSSAPPLLVPLTLNGYADDKDADYCGVQSGKGEAAASESTQRTAGLAAAAAHLQDAAAFTGASSVRVAASIFAYIPQYKSRSEQHQHKLLTAITPPFYLASYRRLPTTATSPARANLPPSYPAIPVKTRFLASAAGHIFFNAIPERKAAAAPPFFTHQKHLPSVAFNGPLRSPSASRAALASSRSASTLSVTQKMAASPGLTAAAPPVTVGGCSTSRTKKTITAAGSLRAAEYSGNSAGPRHRHWESSLNRVTLIGRVGTEPEVRQMSSGDKYAGFSMATSSHWVDKSTGALQGRTEWHRVVVYDESLVDLVDKYLHTGRRVYVEGKLQTRRWTASDGGERYTTSVVVSRYQGDLILLDQPAAVPAPSLAESSGPPPSDERTELPTD